MVQKRILFLAILLSDANFVPREKCLQKQLYSETQVRFDQSLSLDPLHHLAIIDMDK
jgi:hypothetical protein